MPASSVEAYTGVGEFGEKRVCVSLCKTVVHNTAQNSSDNFPLIPQTIIIAQMMSTGEKGSSLRDR